MITEPYQIILDVWEGNYLDVNGKIVLDIPYFISQGVSGMICRINDMQGGHHDDIYFHQLWDMAFQFRRRAIYFVYNPWVTGIANYNWLASRLGAMGYAGRVFTDIEVRYAGYSPLTYYDEVMKYLNLMSGRWPSQTIYTGEWFLSTLSSWPTNYSYWWGSYPSALNGCPSWNEYKKIIATLPFGSYNASKCPGPLDLAQMTGDSYKPVGAFGHAVDTNIFLGTPEKCDTYFGTTAPPIPDPSIKQRLEAQVEVLGGCLGALSDIVRSL